MLKRIIARCKRVSNAYLKYREGPILETCVLLEAGQGKNINGNMFALLREISSNERWAQLCPVFVVTKDMEADALERFRFYQLQAKTVIRNSKEYVQYLAQAKYLITDNSFPPYFAKRDEQIYLNTWHGTPLKTLGVSDIRNAKSLANIQKNYLMSDYALFPNAFTRDVFMNDYMLKNIFKGSILLCDYPRNSAFFDEEKQKELRKNLNLEDKQLIAYMPTWRGSDRNADAQKQKDILHAYFKELDDQLRDDQIFYVNLHFLIGNTMDFTQYDHIMPFPEAYETYDILALCDVLVTDYSSVFFDYAQNERKVILFAYDEAEYMEERGTYISLHDLPFPIVDNTFDLVSEINNDQPIQNRDVFLDTYCHYGDVHTPEKIMDLLVHQKKDELELQEPAGNHKELILIYGGKLRNPQLNTLLLTYIHEMVKTHPDKNIVLSFRGGIHDRLIDMIQQLPEQVHCLAMVTRFELRVRDQLRAGLSMRSHYFAEKFNYRLKREIKREKERLFYHLEPQSVIYYSGNPHYMYKIMDAFTCEKTAHIHHGNIMGLISSKRSYEVMIRYFHKHYQQVYDHRTEDIHALWEGQEDTYYNKMIRMSNIIRIFHNNKDEMKLHAFGVIMRAMPISEKQFTIKIDSHVYQPRMHRLLHFGGFLLVFYTIAIPNKDIPSMDIQNKVILHYEDKAGYALNGSIRYALTQRKKGHNKRGKIRVFQEDDTAALFRQTLTNIMYFTVRKKNLTDDRKEQLKLFWAYYLANIWSHKKITLLFEKEASRYEESASVLYEKLIDKGIGNAYFIIDKHYAYLDQIPDKYRRNLIYKTSFKHYLYFFKAQTFLSSEAMVHAIDLRIANRYAQRKLASKTVDYVFLQHGVMYMVSLDSESRKFFQPKVTKGKYRVVVSSQKEADHFIDLGGYDPDTIYITGLPKFDRNMLQDDADKVVIMPTWRPWEYNGARYDFAQTHYYQMICRIFYAIPKQYHKHVVILPHPLFFDAVKDSDFELKLYLNCDTKYDDILKQTKVLISDYSSITYDAFYRGTNVIFYWEEKDACLDEYGPTTKLMIDEEHAFGDVCYNAEQLQKVFETNYKEQQKKEYQRRYEDIVTYHDGCNTERLIELLQKDEII